MSEAKIIVCAMEFSVTSQPAIDMAIVLAERYGSPRVDALHVIEVAEGYQLARNELRRQIDVEVTRMRWRLRTTSQVEVDAVIRYGRPYREILRYVLQRRADFLVVGTHGRVGLARWFHGSVAERVARLAPCAVVVARSFREDDAHRRA